MKGYLMYFYRKNECINCNDCINDPCDVSCNTACNLCK